MTPEERQMIAGLFDRMRSFGAPDKDRDAEALINQAVRAQPDAPYMLVQSVLVQEHALQEAGNRIQDLEDQVRVMQGGQARPQASGSFLGGLFGGGARPDPSRTGSVPSIGSRAPAPVSGSPWSQGQGAAPPPPASAPPSASSGGGFMKSAMATAAGVAGGMLLADGIRNMMGGSHHAATGQAQASPLAGPGGADKTANADNTSQQPANDQADQHDRNTYDDQGSDSGWDSGGDGGDIEI